MDELKDQTVPQASLAGARDPERDRQRETSVLAALLGNLLARSSRHQQGVVYARAMFVEEAGEVAAQLRRSVVAGEVLAELECLGSIVGLNPSVAPHAAFGKAHREDGPAFCLDLDEGCAGYDLNRVLERAQKSTGPNCQPASRVVLVPLPGFLADDLRRRRKHTPWATHLGDLTGWPEWEGKTGACRTGLPAQADAHAFRRSLGSILLEPALRRSSPPRHCSTFASERKAITRTSSIRSRW